MDIIAIMGSPRKHSNTDILMDEMIKGAEEKRHNVKKYYISDLEFIRAGDAMYACRERTVYLRMTD